VIRSFLPHRSFATLTSIDFQAIGGSHMTSKDQSLNRTLHVIADPTRRRILAALKAKGSGKENGLCASDIESQIHLSQPTISHHMAILEEAGLVQSKKQGQWRWYRRNQTAIRAFTRALKQSL
jgi:ArsR family transcriptional regulator